jgi:hypothetical protein
MHPNGCWLGGWGIGWGANACESRMGWPPFGAQPGLAPPDGASQADRGSPAAACGAIMMFLAEWADRPWRFCNPSPPTHAHLARVRHPVPSSMPVAVILGYGPGVGAAVLRGLVEAGFKVAIAARTASRLEAAAGGFQCALLVVEAWLVRAHVR